MELDALSSNCRDTCELGVSIAIEVLERSGSRALWRRAMGDVVRCVVTAVLRLLEGKVGVEVRIVHVDGLVRNTTDVADMTAVIFVASSWHIDRAGG